ncbi:hypothetical protein ASPWEDRAFT_34390 [Aspergillus wentii DTO 134E9]|uniref:Uncharacterized protein n=1 Tax=Aspergillus wentii DTO 134E9 TaxID=1073089 RepID=A0A1L9S186_ASPWE|nr:uncharacterized protein ASPWEDRAFT_34390 [Aspergillus wentii DTO 134E9]OJJ40926.1 hypothetical protein ASPWEDRAFT_34390 [Aspergillus wentii DTO 134E9]
MKLTTVLLPLGLFVSSSLAVGITITMAGGGTKDLDIPTTGECIDLFQGTDHARLNGGTDGTRCDFWLDSGCSGSPVGSISTSKRESDMAEPANGARCH